MPVYGKTTISGHSPTLPDIKEVEIMSIDEALKALEPSLKAFTALASIYKIISLAKELESAIVQLNKQRNEITTEINKTMTEFKISKDKETAEFEELKKKYISRTAEIKSEQNFLIKEINKLKSERIELLKEIETEHNKAKIKIQAECDSLIAETEKKVKELNTQATVAQARLDSAVKEFNNIKAKFV